MTGTGVSLNAIAQIAEEAKKNGKQGKKECEETQAAKGKEEGKVRERHRPSFKYEIDTSHRVLRFCLEGGGLRACPEFIKG